jgi:hypothetical protein
MEVANTTADQSASSIYSPDESFSSVKRGHKAFRSNLTPAQTPVRDAPGKSVKAIVAWLESSPSSTNLARSALTERSVSLSSLAASPVRKPESPHFDNRDAQASPAKRRESPEHTSSVHDALENGTQATPEKVNGANTKGAKLAMNDCTGNAFKTNETPSEAHRDPIEVQTF